MSNSLNVDRQSSASAARNRTHIREVFLAHMPDNGKILELASGTGEHAIEIAGAAIDLRWFPGDPREDARRSISAWVDFTGLANIAHPHATDASAPIWPVEDQGPFDGMVAINMIHIAPFDAARGLFAGARRLLRPGGRLFLYGPFSRAGVHTAPANADFDANLRSRDPRWGVRDLEGDLLPLAEATGLDLHAVVAMPANNFSVIFKRQ